MYMYTIVCASLVWTIYICMQIGDETLTVIEMLAKADYDYAIEGSALPRQLRQLPLWSFRDTTRVRFSLYLPKQLRLTCWSRFFRCL